MRITVSTSDALLWWHTVASERAPCHGTVHHSTFEIVSGGTGSLPDRNKVLFTQLAPECVNKLLKTIHKHDRSSNQRVVDCVYLNQLMLIQ